MEDGDNDGICDNVDECVGEFDECNVCNGPGAIYDCGCEDAPEGFAIVKAMYSTSVASVAVRICQTFLRHLGFIQRAGLPSNKCWSLQLSGNSFCHVQPLFRRDRPFLSAI